MNIKKLSFAQLIGMFFGGFAVFGLATILVLNMVAKSNSETVAQKRAHVPVVQPVATLQVNDSAELEITQSSLKTLQQVVQQQTQVSNQQFNSISAGMSALDQRLAMIEGARNTVSVQVVKPPRLPRERSIHVPLGQGAEPLPASAGYKVQATAGKRAWIKHGDNEVSVAIGDKLPKENKDLKVTAIDEETGIVVTRVTFR